MTTACSNSVGGLAPVDDVDAPVRSPSVTGPYVAGAAFLKAVRKPCDLEPVAGIPLEIHMLDGADRRWLLTEFGIPLSWRGPLVSNRLFLPSRVLETGVQTRLV
jgi:hypothetical protein